MFLVDQTVFNNSFFSMVFLEVIRTLQIFRVLNKYLVFLFYNNNNSFVCYSNSCNNRVNLELHLECGTVRLQRDLQLYLLVRALEVLPRSKKL